MEYAANVLAYCILYDLGLGRPGTNRKNSPEYLYNMIVNSSLGAYIDIDSDNCILHDVFAAVDDDKIVFLPKVTFHLCHAGPESKISHVSVTKFFYEI